MTQQSKVRIVMPIYNYADYITAGIQSVLRQDEPNWQLYLVDDDSSDATPEICQRFAQQDSRIHFVQQQNGGQYNIVNRYTAWGLELEEGLGAPYNCVLDGDDQLASDYLSTMLHFAQNYDCDVVLCSHKNLQKGGKPRYMHRLTRPEIFDNQEQRGRQGQNLVLQFLHGVFPMPDSGTLVSTELRRKIMSLLPTLPLYAATDDLQSFFLACHARRIGHIGRAKYLRNLASAGTWRNVSAEFRLQKVYSILFSINYIQHLVAQWPTEQQASVASCYMLRWLRYNFLRTFAGLEAKEQHSLLQAAVQKVHEFEPAIFISPREQMDYLANMPALPKLKKAEGWQRRLRSCLRDLLPYGYVQREKGDAPVRAR